MRYDPHEPNSAQPNSAQIKQPVSGKLMNFKDESYSPDGSPVQDIEVIPESQELDILRDDSLACDEDSYEEPKENECDLVDDDFFQNLMKKPPVDEQDISKYLQAQ